MEQRLDKDALFMLKQKRRRKTWSRIVSIMMCVVVFCTTYALILPAITKETDTFCGMEAHTHADACYNKTLLCEGHVHADTCFETHSQQICLLDETEGHSHTEACIPTMETVLSCSLEETEGHTHSAECGVTEQVLSCGLEETSGHSHTDTCTSKTLTCSLPEDENHIHDDSCYIIENICGQEESAGHSHTDACYTSKTTYTCGLEEMASHQHNEACYTETTTYSCGQQEVEAHTHTEACFEVTQVQICTIETNPEHEHTESCYDKQLICELEEHEHSLPCYADPNADLETAKDWEASLPAELSGVYAEDVLAIAKSQLGYAESANNYTVVEGETKGYTRYGAWYGIPYGDWCAMYASFCYHYAGVEGVPLHCNCPAWINELKELGLFHGEDDYIPNPGDLIFFDWNANGESDHVGLVTEVDGDTVKTIEGNSANSVRYESYALSDNRIQGYGALPTVEGVVQTTLSATIYTDGTYLKLAEDETVITVSGVLPMNAEVRAFPSEMEAGELNALCVYDIEIFLEDGTVYVHEGDPLSVKFSSPQIDEICNTLVTPEVYYIPEAGEPEPMETVVEEGNVTFETPHFSTYALVVPANAIKVSNQQQLVAAWNDLADGDEGTIQLTADFQVNTTFTLNNANANIVLDLNGHTLSHTGDASLFQVQNGALTVGDSIPMEETITDMGPVTVNTLGAHVATTQVQNNKVTLTYYITESQIVDTANGATEETLVQHTVTGAGTILADASAPVFQVTGGTLNIDSGMYYGGTNRAIYQTGGTANLTGGYICGFTRANPANVNANGYNSEVEASCGGAVWSVGGGAELNVLGTVLAGNKAASGGAIFTKNSILTIDGGIISGNESTVTGNNPENEEGWVHFGGGGILTRGETKVTMTSGYITNNLAHSVCYWDGGGGILLDDTSTITVNGGYFTGNEAASGGAIRTNWQRGARVMLNDGYFCANYGRTAEGGAISISQHAEAYIYGGHYNNNRTDNVTHWGGGAIFGANGSRIFLERVIVTGNEAGGFGGGLAGCSTGRVQVLVNQGGAVFNNTALGTNMSGSESDKREDTLYAYGDPVFMSSGYADFFCALNSVIDGSMLGGYSAEWTGSSDGNPVAVAAKDKLHSAYVAGLTANPSAAGIQAAQNVAAVFINGNYSNTHGGGALCNGYMLIGEPPEVTLGSRIYLEATKELVGENGEYLNTDADMFKFEVINEHTKEHMAYGTNDADGNITFDHLLPFTAPGVYSYLIKEIPTDNTTITYDTTQYRLTVTVTTIHDTVSSDKEEVPRTWYQISNATVERYDGETWTQLSSTDPPDNDDGATKIPLSAGATFTNLQLERKDITVVKRWTGDTPNLSVTVRLYQNGEQYGDAKVLNAGNSWTYTWNDLPVYTKDGEGNVTGIYSYNVQEDPVEGYRSDYEITNSSQVEEYWIPAYYVANELVPGERYLITYQDGNGDNQVLTIKTAKNNHLNTNDLDVVKKGTGSIKYNEQTILDYIPAADTDDRSIFRAMEMETGLGHEGTILYNVGASTALLVETAGNHHLKTTSDWGMGAGWYSRFFYDGTQLYGNYAREDTGRWVVTYEDYGNNNSLFDADNTDNLTHYAKLYVLVPAGAATETTVTITNTPVEEVLYELDLTKVNSRDNNIKLAGAVFNLLDQNGKPLSFVKESEGSFRLHDGEGTVTDLVTNTGGKLMLKGLPKGEYLLKEKQAPPGYLPIEDREIHLPEDLEEGKLSLALTVADPPESMYELPKTGGTGTQMYTTAGLLLMLTSAAYLMYIRTKRRKEVN